MFGLGGFAVGDFECVGFGQYRLLLFRCLVCWFGLIVDRIS